MHSVVLLLTLSACSFVDDALTTVKGLVGGETEDPKAKAGAPAPEAKDTVVAAKKLLGKGKAAEALEAAEKALAAHPDDDAAWEIVEIAALRSGSAAAMLDKLSPDQPIGGRPEKHFALRGALALQAGRLPDVLLASRALASAAPGDAAALLARAVGAGLQAPADLDATTLELIRRVQAPTADPAVGELAAAVDALPGWRVAALRGELALARGYKDGALAEAAKAEPGGVLGAQAAASLKVAAAADATSALAAADAGAKAAWALGDAQGAATILAAAETVVFGGWKAAGLADLAQGLRKDVAGADNVEGAAAIAVIEAEAALRAGQPARAREAATAAAASTVAKARGSWDLALAEAALGNPDAVIAAAGGASEPYGTAARELAAAMGGADPTLPSAGLAGDDAALQALLGAGWLDDPSAAVRAATAAPSADLRLWAEAWGSRATLPTEGASPARQAEATVRTRLAAGGGQSGPLPDTTHPHALGWTAALGGGGDAGTDPLGAWARASTALSTGDGASAAKELGDLAGAFPTWRVGPWAPVLVMDGPQPDELVQVAHAAASSADPVAPVAILHGWKHAVDRARSDWAHGVDPVPPGAVAAQRTAVWDAVAAVRAGELAWLAGAAPWPGAAVAALDAAEKAVGLAPQTPATVAELRTAMDKSGIISFARFGGALQLLLITTETASVELPADGIETEIGAFTEAIVRGEKAVAEGDRLRGNVLDRYNKTLVGIGRFVVVGAAPAGLLPITAMPEQQEGIRFLAEIRNVVYAPDFNSVALRKLPTPEKVKVAKEEKAEKKGDKKKAEADAVIDPVAAGPSINCLAVVSSPAEAEVLRRVFPTGLVLLQGPTASVATFRAKLKDARYVHIGDLPSAAGGGWTLADGTLRLRDLVDQEVVYDAIYLGGRAKLGEVPARLSVGRKSGAQDAMATAGWSGEDFHGLLVQHWWEGVNRRYAGVRAFAEARSSTIKELGEAKRVPTNWGGYFLSGRP